MILRLIKFYFLIFLCFTSSFEAICSINTQANDSNIIALKNFAEEYTPQNVPNEAPASLPVLSENLMKAVNIARIVNEKKCEQYLSLIILKLYRAHLECCHQSYDLRKGNFDAIDSLTNPILFGFIKISGLYEINKPIEFIPSSIAYTWIDQNKQLLKYKPIKREYDKIKKAEQMMNKSHNELIKKLE